jgi:hypothetical protein
VYLGLGEPFGMNLLFHSPHIVADLARGASSRGVTPSLFRLTLSLFRVTLSLSKGGPPEWNRPSRGTVDLP